MQTRGSISASRFSDSKEGQGRELEMPPSPAYTQSTLTQSNSNSNSTSTPSTSPQQPITPPRSGRARRQYGELGRVPLHRRGTSQTYERLEDLLREAGYKETRIFTPETDRAKPGEDGNDQDQKGPIGALVNFISNFMPSAAASQASLLGSPEDHYKTNPLTRQNTLDSSRSSKPPLSWPSPTNSPLSHRGQSQNQTFLLPPGRRQSQSPPETSPPSVMTSSIESLEPTQKASKRQGSSGSTTPIPQAQHTNVSQRPNPQLQIHQPSPRKPTPNDLTRPGYALPPHLRQQESQTSLRPQERLVVSPLGATARILDPQSQSPLVYPMPSKAGAYLRHIASQPNIPRPNSTPVSTDRRKGTSPRRTLVLNDTDDEYEGRPPMPSTWLQTVAKAVLFGGLGAHVGQPSPSIDSASSSSTTSTQKTLRPTRSSLSQISPQHRRSYRRRHQPGLLLSDRTNVPIEARSSFLAPPDLFVRVATTKLATTTGVAKTRVVCRSAPTSRSNSRVRGSPPGERRAEKVGDVGRKAKERLGRRSSWKGAKRAEKDGVPSLANTDVEGDDELPWSPRGHKSHKNRDTKDRFRGGWGMPMGMTKVPTDEDHDIASPSEGDEDEDEEDDEEDEVMDLARILVPPKRQNSIKSLRRHLEGALESDIRDGVRGRGQVRSRSASAKRPLRSAGDGKGDASSKGDNKQSLPYDGSEAEDCQWGQGWVKGGGGARGRRNMGMGDEGEGEEFYERGGGKFGSGRSTVNGRAVFPGGWGLAGAA